MSSGRWWMRFGGNAELPFQSTYRVAASVSQVTALSGPESFYHHAMAKKAYKLKHAFQSHRGFTLIELMVTITLLAILTTLAIPSFQAQIASTRLSSAVNSLSATIATARAEAIRRGARITVCRSDSTNAQCTTATTGGWETGWITLEDSIRTTSSPTVDTGETINAVEVTLPDAIKVSGNGDMVNYISFTPTGQPKTYTGGFAAGRIRVCSTSASLSDSNRARELVISLTGRVVIEKVSSASSACSSI
jgi:type IV fimbrial biogenesis protein FimT